MTSIPGKPRDINTFDAMNKIKFEFRSIGNNFVFDSQNDNICILNDYNEVVYGDKKPLTNKNQNLEGSSRANRKEFFKQSLEIMNNGKILLVYYNFSNELFKNSNYIFEYLMKIIENRKKKEDNNEISNFKESYSRRNKDYKLLNKTIFKDVKNNLKRIALNTISHQKKPSSS